MAKNPAHKKLKEKRQRLLIGLAIGACLLVGSYPIRAAIASRLLTTGKKELASNQYGQAEKKLLLAKVFTPLDTRPTQLIQVMLGALQSVAERSTLLEIINNDQAEARLTWYARKEKIADSNEAYQLAQNAFVVGEPRLTIELLDRYPMTNEQARDYWKLRGDSFALLADIAQSSRLYRKHALPLLNEAAKSYEQALQIDRLDTQTINALNQIRQRLE